MLAELIQSIKDWWRALNMQVRFVLLIQGCLIIILLFAQHWIMASFEKQIMVSAEGRALATADGIINGMNMLMLTGTISDSKNRLLFINKMANEKDIKYLRIIRAEQVTRQFGPGLPGEQADDEIEKEVLKTGKIYSQQLGINGTQNQSPVLRVIVPFIVSRDFRGTDCLSCHHVEVGSVNGAASILLDLSDDQKRIQQISARLWLGQLVLQLLLFVIIWYLVRSFIRPIKSMTDGLNHIAEGDIAGGHHLPISLRDEIGQATQAFNRVMDITHDLIDAQQLARSVFDNSSEGIVICDRNGYIVTTNRAFTYTTGYTAEEAVGKTPGAILESGKQDKEFYRIFWDSLLTNGKWQGEIWDKRKNGELYPVWLTINAVSNTPLRSASDKGHKDVAELLIAKGVDINAKNDKGFTALYATAYLGHKDVAELLIAKGADVNVKGNGNFTPLHAAALHGHKDIAELLIAKGADVNAKDKDGATPLHSAAGQWHRDVAELLIAKGADVNAKDKDGRTPVLSYSTVAQAGINEYLLQAAEAGNVKEVSRLLADGADVNTRGKDGETPLHAAALRGYKEVAGLLIAHGADINPKAKADVTPLHVAASQGHNGVAELLIAKGADVNAKAENGNTPLENAAWHGHKDVAELLIAKGAEIDARGIDEATPLYEAAKLDQPEAAGLLIAHGADINAKTKSGYTPLIIAAINGNRGAVELLIEKGADVNAKDKQGLTPLIWTFNSLRHAHTLMSPSPAAELARKLSSLNGARLEQEREELRHVKGQWHEVAILLINYGADVAIKVGDMTPIYIASMIGDKDLADALITMGADTNKAGDACDACESPLHAAIAEGHLDVAKLLINKGANVNARNMSQKTPLHFLASSMDDRELAELMIAKGADINARDKDGSTPLAYAIGNGHGAVAEVLRQHDGI